VEAFEQVHAETLEQIIATAGSHAYDDLGRHAHTLKGAAAALAMDALMASADEVEHAAHARDAARLEPTVRSLSDLFHASLAELRTVVG
jgi:HPt (histidine-containing phosphotransfer) domain-containing protein